MCKRRREKGDEQSGGEKITGERWIEKEIKTPELIPLKAQLTRKVRTTTQVLD